MQEIKNESKSTHRDETALHELISTRQGELLKADEKSALSLRYLSRRMFGYIHSIQLAPTLRIVLLHEPLVRLYHGLASKDIVYFDTTGSVVEKIRRYKRILYYALCVRHPFGKTPTLAVAEFVSSSHKKEAISRSISIFHEKEKVRFSGQIAQPVMIVTYNSLACLHEFNNMSSKQYIEISYKIVLGGACYEDVKTTLLHICYSHTMKFNKHMIDTIAKKDTGKRIFDLKEFLMGSVTWGFI